MEITLQTINTMDTSADIRKWLEESGSTVVMSDSITLSHHAYVSGAGLIISEEPEEFEREGEVENKSIDKILSI